MSGRNWFSVVIMSTGWEEERDEEAIGVYNGDLLWLILEREKEKEG